MTNATSRAVALLGVLAGACSDVSVPSAADLESHPFLVHGTEVRGLYMNRDVCCEAFCYRTQATDLGLLHLLQEKVRPLGFERVADIDGVYRFRRGDEEARVRHDPTTGSVFVAILERVDSDTAWADRNLWIHLPSGHGQSVR